MGCPVARLDFIISHSGKQEVSKARESILSLKYPSRKSYKGIKNDQA
jgi:hypothetical protein